MSKSVYLELDSRGTKFMVAPANGQGVIQYRVPLDATGSFDQDLANLKGSQLRRTYYGGMPSIGGPPEWENGIYPFTAIRISAH